ncbi:DM13 domain-containing protein [Microbacterium invictum]|uniref:DM13 domain-containing protein n=1 Tax=Microbacterium invictum TaxID=515415 RepID=A0ABZ0VE11_9MICO|nr:DM13 domain-containing protein [Microbacterium invictum]WQB71484.1 DM13 domain-containing protein [Microbacterium invictum]
MQKRDASTPRRSRRIWIIGGTLALAAGVIAALVFQPWLALIDVRVDDEIPVAVATPAPSPTAEPQISAPSEDGAPEASAPPAPAGPVDLLSGTFISHEHATSGTVRVIENPDGSRYLAIEDLATTNGPDVHVWLSAGPVVEGFDGWFTAAQHPFVDLGQIKGNLGDQLYEIPDDVDLDRFRTVDLWCVQFSVSFGAAALG